MWVKTLKGDQATSYINKWIVEQQHKSVSLKVIAKSLESYAATIRQHSRYRCAETKLLNLRDNIHKIVDILIKNLECCTIGMLLLTVPSHVQAKETIYKNLYSLTTICVEFLTGLQCSTPTSSCIAQPNHMRSTSSLTSSQENPAQESELGYSKNFIITSLLSHLSSRLMINNQSLLQQSIVNAFTEALTHQLINIQTLKVTNDDTAYRTLKPQLLFNFFASLSIYSPQILYALRELSCKESQNYTLNTFQHISI